MLGVKDVTSQALPRYGRQRVHQDAGEAMARTIRPSMCFQDLSAAGQRNHGYRKCTN